MNFANICNLFVTKIISRISKNIRKPKTNKQTTKNFSLPQETSQILEIREKKLMLKYSICFSHETTFQTHSIYFDYGHYGFSISKPFT